MTDLRAAVGRADLVRLLRACPESAPALAHQLGFRVQSPRQEGKADASPGAAPASSKPDTSAPAAAPLPPAHIWRVAEEEQRALPAATPPERPVALPPEGGDVLAAPPPPELTPWPALWPRLFDLIAEELPSHAPDVPRLVRTLAAGRPLTHVPRRLRKRWPERLTMWIDRHVDLVPIWADQDAIRRRLDHLVPDLEEQLERPDFVPRSGQTALLLGDLTSLPGARQRAREAEARQARVAALTARPATVPGWRAAPWQTPLAHAGTPETRAHRLLALVAGAVYLRPADLRALRMTLPAAEADVTTELDVWQHRDVAARAPDGMVLDPTVARRWRRLGLDAHETLAGLHADLPLTIRAAEALVGGASPDFSNALTYFEQLLAHIRAGDLAALADVARHTSAQLASAIDRHPELTETISLLWVAGHPEPDTAVPEGIDPSKASLIRPGDPTDLHLLHAEGALRLAAGRPQGIRLAGLRSTQPVAWVGQGPTRRQQRLGEPIDLAQATRIEIETDLSRVVVEKLERPAWALAFGVRQGRVWADADLDGAPRRLWWTAGETWEGADGYGADSFGVYHLAEFGRESMRFRLIPAGEFLMGSPDDEGGDGDEHPQHPVRLTAPFWLADVPVTQAVWQAVMGQNPAHFKGPDRPVESVSWDDAQAFIAAASTPGRAWRLPTEAQWEYACRAGTTGPRYGDLDAVAWWSGNSSGQTHPVGRKQPNLWGLYDMLGNVWEWCADGAYRRYETTLQVDSAGPAGGSRRVSRGGSWSGSAWYVRAAYRGGRSPGRRYRYLGFRLSRGQAAPSPRSGQPRAEPAPPARSAGPSGQARSAGGGARPEGGAKRRSTEEDP